MADPSLSIIVTHRSADRFRQRNLAMVSLHMSAVSGVELIVVEQDDRPRLEIGDWGMPVRHRFVYNPELFNRSWGLNIGARMARAAVLLLLDGDLLLETGAVEAAADACRHGVSAINPYNELIDLSPEDSCAVCDSHRDLNGVADHRRNRTWTDEVICFCGGAYVIDAAFYREIGGHDEDFEGWGGEDDAMSIKIFQLARRVMTLADARAWHLYHPRREGNVYDTTPYLRNKTLAEAYQSMSVEELRRRGEAQRDRNGDCDKYRKGKGDRGISI